MLPVPVPAPALGSRAEEALTALVRHEREGGRPLCITHYLLGLISDDLDQLPGGNELFQGWDQHSAGGEGREQSIPVQAAGWRARNPPLSCLAQRVRLNRQGWILGQSLGSGSAEVPAACPDGEGCAGTAAGGQEFCCSPDNALGFGMACAVCWECDGLACRREEKSQWNWVMLPEQELSIPRCGYPSSSGGKSALFAQDSLPGRFPAWKMLPLLPLPDVLASPGVLEPPGEPEAATSGESPRRWHGGCTTRWREMQQSRSCLFSLRCFLTSFYTNPGCLVPIQGPAGQEQWGRMWAHV